MRYTVALCAFLLTMFTIAARAAQTAETSDWRVIALIGDWKVLHGTSSEAATPGMSVKASDSVEHVKHGASSHGSITILVGPKRTTFSCDDVNSLPDPIIYKGCSLPIPLAFVPKKIKEQNQPSNRLLDSLGTVFHDNPYKFFKADVRGLGNLEDAVVKRQGSAIDWTPAFANLTTGMYRASFLDANTNTSKTANHAALPESTITWNQETSIMEGMPLFEKGLRQMNITSIDGIAVGDTWVLIEDSSAFDAKDANFKEVKRITADWTSDVPPAGIKGVLRAVLTELSRE